MMPDNHHEYFQGALFPLSRNEVPFGLPGSYGYDSLSPSTHICEPPAMIAFFRAKDILPEPVYGYGKTG
jgi:hypothetical protein